MKYSDQLSLLLLNIISYKYKHDIKCLIFLRNIIDFSDTNYICHKAAVIGDLFLLKYLYNNDFPLNASCIEIAAEKGHLKIVKYLHEKGRVPFLNECVMIYAARNGHLEIVKYLCDNGCPYDG